MLTKLELQIMQVIWKRETSSVSKACAPTMTRAHWMRFKTGDGSRFY
jgi:predicted transcriptional regulator